MRRLTLTDEEIGRRLDEIAIEYERNYAKTFVDAIERSFKKQGIVVDDWDRDEVENIIMEIRRDFKNFDR